MRKVSDLSSKLLDEFDWHAIGVRDVKAFYLVVGAGYEG
jgi:hypothetical protein